MRATPSRCGIHPGLNASGLQIAISYNKTKGMAFRVSTKDMTIYKHYQPQEVMVFSSPNSMQFMHWVTFTKSNTFDILPLSGCQMNRARKIELKVQFRFSSKTE